MQTHTNIEQWRGATAIDSNGDKVGSIDEVYLDRGSQAPEWVTVSTGLFGTRTSFVPISDADYADGEVRLGYTKDQIKDAPNIDADGALSREEEQRLYEHYGRGDYDNWDGSDARDHDADRDTTGHDTSGPTTDGAMTVSEEELRVGTTEREAGRARLRKYVVEEEVTKTVPVRREEVRVEREPITDANRGDAVDGPAISEEEHEVVLHAEEVVVDKQAVPKERIRLETDVTTEEETVSETVRKERVDVDGERRRHRPPVALMEIPKDKIIALIKEHGQADQAGQAEQELPEQVDPDRDAGLLAKFGLEPKDVLSKLGGGLPGL